MKLNITGISKDKYQCIQTEIIKILFKNGIEDFETIVLEDGITEEFQGFEFEIENKANWLVWDGWVGNHDQRIEGAKCSNCSFIHPTVYKSLDNLYKICPICGSTMSVKVD